MNSNRKNSPFLIPESAPSTDVFLGIGVEHAVSEFKKKALDQNSSFASAMLAITYDLGQSITGVRRDVQKVLEWSLLHALQKDEDSYWKDINEIFESMCNGREVYIVPVTRDQYFRDRLKVRELIARRAHTRVAVNVQLMGE